MTLAQFKTSGKAVKLHFVGERRFEVSKKPAPEDPLVRQQMI